jgi:drug/metabolite transporter (DMT)-like permease
MGLLFALLTTFSWAIGIFPFTEASRRLGINALNHFRLLLAVIMLFILSVSIAPQQFFKLFSVAYAPAWFWFGLSGIIGLALGDYFFFGLYAIMGARIGSVFTTISPAAALITSKLLIDERINVIGILGIFITMSGVFLISWNRNDDHFKINEDFGSRIKGVVYGILAAVCQGVGLVLAKRGFLELELNHENLQPIHASFIRMSVSLATLVCFTIISGKWNQVVFPIIINRMSGVKYAVAGSFFGPVFGVAMSLYTITLIEATVAQTIFSLVPVVAAGIAFVFLKEKFSVGSLIATLLAVAGVVILLWRDQLMSILFRV